MSAATAATPATNTAAADDALLPVSAVTKLPQKKYYRQRAHANPLSDHAFWQ